jgi:hypothetical protein
MIQFNAIIEKFGKLGENTGWTYILIPEALAQELNPGFTGLWFHDQRG